MKPISKRKDVMRKSYVSETSLKVQVEIDLGEIENLISSLSDLDTTDGKNWRAKELVSKLEKLKREAAEEARRGFERILEQS
jgi:hypothetical protein